MRLISSRKLPFGEWLSSRDERSGGHYAVKTKRRSTNQPEVSPFVYARLESGLVRPARRAQVPFLNGRLFNKSMCFVPLTEQPLFPGRVDTSFQFFIAAICFEPG